MKICLSRSCSLLLILPALFVLNLLSIAALPASADDTNTSSLIWTQNDTEQLSTGSPRVVLKNGNTLLVLDKSGMIDPRPGSPYGLFEDDTRHLSCWQLRIDNKEPTLLAAFTQHGFEGSFLYGIADSMMIERQIVIQDGLSEQIRFRSFVDKPLKFKFQILNNCDFKDMFEVRGIKRFKFGVIEPAKLGDLNDKELLNRFSYLGVDKLERFTTLNASLPKPNVNAVGKLEYEITLAPRSTQTIELRIDTSNTPAKSAYSFASAKAEATKSYDEWVKNAPNISMDWSLLSDLVSQASLDLYLLKQKTPYGPCLAAGLPWYSTAFGRDQCITALQTLPFMPDISRDVLKVLAAYQGKVHDPDTEEEPGRIMHELRLGDMARSKEIAFRPYYGTVDATPLWLMLLTRYVDATGDLELGKTLWPNVEKAFDYIDKCNDTTGGFLYYGGKNGAALSNQAWKDSFDSIMHKDGKLATAPIAVCEVQGYLYDAYVGCAKLADKLGHPERAKQLNEKAQALKEKFRSAFWLPSEHIVALALDGTSRPCDVVASNAGHLLSTGILDDEMANAIADRLMKDDMFSGWGIRTLSTKEVRYNPLSYHDGSVWPHDNAMIVEGLAHRGKMEAACTVMESLVQSAKTASDARLPELFCGFPRSDFPAPVPYSVSCVPQAWAAGTVFQMLKSVLGISLVDNKIHIDHPSLPKSINYLSLSGWHTGKGKDSATVTFKRNPDTGKVSVSSSSSDVIISE